MPSTPASPIISAAIVGSGELILTTKLGAEAGFTLLHHAEAIAETAPRLILSAVDELLWLQRGAGVLLGGVLP